MVDPSQLFQFRTSIAQIGVSLLFFSTAARSTMLAGTVCLTGIGWLLLMVAGREILIEICTRKRTVHKSGAVLISGASSGIGKAAALALDAKGFTVFAGVRKKADAERLTELRSSLEPIMLDVADEKAVEAAVEDLTSRLEAKGLELVGLVNNAGISTGLPLELEPFEETMKMFQVNTFGMFRLTKACIPMLRESRGRIVNICSLSGVIGRPMKATYTATKFAMQGFSDCLRLELAKWDVSVSVIEPGYVKTPITEKQVGANLQHNDLGDKEYKLYEHILAGFEAKRLKNHNRGATTLVTDRAIVHALSDPYPRPRYTVAKAGALPAILIRWLFWFIPDVVRDVVLARA